MDQDTLIVDHIVSVRKRVCPRTSYATSGAAGSVLCAFVSTSKKNEYNTLLSVLQGSEEFERVQTVTSISDLSRVVNGNVVLICDTLNSESMAVVESIFSAGKTKLVVSVNYGNKGSNHISLEKFSVLEHTSGTCHIQSLYNYRQSVNPTAAAALGFNNQPSVQSGSQYKYLWAASTPQIEGGKDRVLQRLADKTLFGSGVKLSTQQWDGLVAQALSKGLDDYGVYNMIREKILGTSLAHDLQIDLSDAKDKAKKDPEEEGDGRANHMVSRTLESVPLRLRQGEGSIRCMLDYGCAEGAITAALGKQLGLPPARILGADVRSIPSIGFTFLPLSAEDTIPPVLGSILPSLGDGSVDLITSAMVFHHVTHVKAVLLELRRVVSPQGALVIREHHCVSADMGAFLDITHGLYSLSWSSPVEWPDFIPEYKAFYRSREEWDALARECGFILSLDDCGPQAHSNYRAAEYAKRKSNGFFPNVIKAYYATYRPDPRYKLPIVVKTTPVVPVSVLNSSLKNTDSSGNSNSSTNNSNSSSGDGNKKRALTFEDNDTTQKRQNTSVNSTPHNTHTNNTATNTANTTNSTTNNSTNPAYTTTTNTANTNTATSTTEENPMFESKKYPGKFYRINKVTGATEWVQ